MIPLKGFATSIISPFLSTSSLCTTLLFPTKSRCYFHICSWFISFATALTCFYQAMKLLPMKLPMPFHSQIFADLESTLSDINRAFLLIFLHPVQHPLTIFFNLSIEQPWDIQPFCRSRLCYSKQQLKVLATLTYALTRSKKLFQLAKTFCPF